MKNKLILTTILLMLCCMVVQAAQDIDTVWMRQTQSDILSVSFHPSSQFFATGNTQWYAGMWDVNTGTETKKYTNYPGGNVFFSKTGKYLVQASTTGSGVNDSTGFQIHDFTNDSLMMTFKGVFNPIMRIAMSSDEENIAVGGSNTIEIWNIKNNQSIFKYDTSGLGGILNLDYSPDGSHIAFSVAGPNKKLRMLNIITKKIDFEYPIGSNAVLKYSNDGTKIAFTSADSGEAVKIMDVNSKQIIDAIPGASYGISSIVFRKDDKYIILPAGDIYVYNLEEKKFTYIYAYESSFHNLSVSEDNKYFATSIGNDLFLLNACFEPTSVPQKENIINATIVYPNPANNNIINLLFVLVESSNTIINIYDINGQNVKKIENKYLPFGSYLYTVDLSTITNGSYYLNISSGNYHYSQSLIINR